MKPKFEMLPLTTQVEEDSVCQGPESDGTHHWGTLTDKSFAAMKNPLSNRLCMKCNQFAINHAKKLN